MVGTRVASGLALLAAVALHAGSAGAEARESVALSAVPAAVREAAAVHGLGVTFDRAAVVEGADGRSYDLSGPLPDGQRVAVSVTADGTVREVRQAIEMAVVPEAVALAVVDEAEGFDLDAVEKVLRPDAIVYVFEGRLGARRLVIEVSVDGTAVAIDERDD